MPCSTALRQPHRRVVAVLGSFTVVDDDEGSSLAVFAGQELMPNRFLYIGQSVTTHPGLSPDQSELLDSIVPGLTRCLEGIDGVVSVSTDKGIIIACFD